MRAKETQLSAILWSRGRVFPAARAVLLSMRAREDFGCAEKLSAAERIKLDCCRTPAVVSIFTDSAACVLSFHHSTPLHL